jgi:hypothetical protein
MANSKLSANDLETIKEWNDSFGRAIEAIEKAKQLAIGDFLVLYVGNDIKSMKLQLNSYGAPVKYKVVHSTEHGIPFLKKVNKKGTPVGQIYSCTGGLDSDDYRYSGQSFEFRLDPDFADAILLDDEYDPAQLHRSKQDIFKAVTKHNKEVKLNTSTIQDVVAVFQNAQVGDTLWTSNAGFYLIQDKTTMTAKDFNDKAKWSEQTRIKGPYVIVLTVRDKNSKVRQISPDFFHHKALYKERPRTYKELKI